MKDNDQVRRQVSDAYAQALKGGGCCSGNTELAGYSPEQLDSVPADASANSFGCGNPLGMAGVGEGETVLDLGSGAGIDVILAAGLVGPTGKVIGVDMTDDMIQRAQQNIADAGIENVEIRKGTIESLPVPDESVDWVISNCVINLSPEKDRVFAEIARVLKPGGQILISDMVAENLPEWVVENPALYCSCVSGAVSEADYLQGLRKAGLIEVEVRDRLVYSASQILGFVSEEPTLIGGGCCGSNFDSTPEIMAKASEVEGKVQSLKFYGRKG